MIKCWLMAVARGVYDGGVRLRDCATGIFLLRVRCRELILIETCRIRARFATENNRMFFKTFSLHEYDNCLFIIIALFFIRSSLSKIRSNASGVLGRCFCIIEDSACCSSC